LTPKATTPILCSMQIGYIGLGKMGKNMVVRMHEKDVEVIAWNRSLGPREEASSQGVKTADTVEELISNLSIPRIVWMMLPSGEPTDDMINKVLPLLAQGDLLIDGANSNYNDTLRRKEKVLGSGVRFMDIGVSGGPSGARNGACLMVGGQKSDYDSLVPLFEKLAAPEAYGYFGPHGAGHFVKMVHNGIEYGMMQSIAEGAAVLKGSTDFNLDLAEVFRVYNNQSVITSRLVEWAKNAIRTDPELENISSKINHSGEGEWTIDAAKKYGIEVPVIEKSLKIRNESTEESNSFRDKMVSALRGQFGGHAVEK